MSIQDIFDSHAHYDSQSFDGDREEVLRDLPRKDVFRVINCGSDLESSRFSLKLAETYPFFDAAAGLHPESVGEAPQDWETQLHALLSQPKIVALGEIGLDYYWKENAPRPVQKQFLEAQLRIAREYDLPVILHDREAHGDMLEILRSYRPKGVVHCFSGSVEMMEEVVWLGLYIGLGGAVTFKNARVPLEVAKAVPLDRLLNETDCPYMAPVPYRGKRCDSSMIVYSAAKIAECKGISVQEVLRAGKENACKLFSVN